MDKTFNYEALLKRAIDKDESVEKLQELMTLVAREHYYAALRKFQAMNIEIIKTQDQEARDETGEVKRWKSADLADIRERVLPALNELGFAIEWKSAAAGPEVVVRCVMTHSGGHSEFNELQACRDDTGGKSSGQAVSSTVTLLRRYTLLGVIGQAMKRDDDDGNGARAARTESKAPPASSATSAPPALPAMSDEQFKRDLPGWQASIKRGDQSGENIVAFLSTRFTLTPAQTKRLRAMRPAKAKE